MLGGQMAALNTFLSRWRHDGDIELMFDSPEKNRRKQFYPQSVIYMVSRKKRGEFSAG